MENTFLTYYFCIINEKGLTFVPNLYIMMESEKGIESLCIYAENISTLCGIIILGLLSIVILETNSSATKQESKTVGFWCAFVSSRGNSEIGKRLFINHCASCHSLDMKTNSTGPALSGIREDWAQYPVADLRNWIRNSQAMIRKKHPKAIALWQKWKPTKMTSFKYLSDDEIDEILKYIGY